MKMRKGLVHVVCACVMFSVKFSLNFPVNSRRTSGSNTKKRSGVRIRMISYEWLYICTEISQTVI